MIAHIDEGFDFLGFPHPAATRSEAPTKRYVYTYPSKKALRLHQGQGARR